MKLNEVIPWGRSFDEYRRIFALSGDDLAGTVLGCGDGPARFNAEAAARGYPLVTFEGKVSSHFAPVREHLERAGLGVEVLSVRYELVKADDHAGNRMMQVRRGQNCRPPC